MLYNIENIARIVGWCLLSFSWINVFIPYKNKQTQFQVGLCCAITALCIFGILLQKEL